MDRVTNQALSKVSTKNCEAKGRNSASPELPARICSSLPRVVSRDEHSRCEIAGGVQHRGEEVRNGVDRDQNPDPLGWQAEGEEKWREHDERAARNARDGKGEEDRGEGDRCQTAEVQRDAVEPA